MSILPSLKGLGFQSTNFPSVKTLGYRQAGKGALKNITAAAEPPSSPENLDRARLLQIIGVLR
jgi:hypothetical protein